MFGIFGRFGAELPVDPSQLEHESQPAKLSLPLRKLALSHFLFLLLLPTSTPQATETFIPLPLHSLHSPWFSVLTADSHSQTTLDKAIATAVGRHSIILP